MEITATFTGLDAALDDLERSLGEELPHGLSAAADAIARDAHDDHAFTNRTGALEASIHGEAVAFTGLGDLAARVVADTDYASYVNDREEFAFLQPERADEPPVSEALEASLTAAVRDAGWRP